MLKEGFLGLKSTVSNEVTWAVSLKKDEGIYSYYSVGKPTIASHERTRIMES